MWGRLFVTLQAGSVVTDKQKALDHRGNSNFISHLLRAKTAGVVAQMDDDGLNDRKIYKRSIPLYIYCSSRLIVISSIPTLSIIIDQSLIWANVL